jgi:hypothetical protein
LEGGRKMYVLYKKFKIDNGYKYVFQEQTSLFGCNSGYIPYLLQKLLKPKDTEPFAWELDLNKAFKQEDMENYVLVINLKPYSKEPNLSLYELVKVWGYSAFGWTPVMFYIRGLFIDENPHSFDEKNFFRKEEEIEDPIFSMLYLHGTVINGKISGRWTPPSPSSTNSVLLWPDTFKYFSREAEKIIKSKEIGLKAVF